jgi:hypothetical protein
MSNIVQDIERLNLLECVREFGFCKGSEIYWLHKFNNLNSNRFRSRTDLENEVVEKLQICSRSTYTKTHALLNRICPKLLNREKESKLKLLTNESYSMEGHDE